MYAESSELDPSIQSLTCQRGLHVVAVRWFGLFQSFPESLFHRRSCGGIIALLILFHHLLLTFQGHPLRHLQNVTHLFSDYNG
jgi:hypothetical protein